MFKIFIHVSLLKSSKNSENEQEQLNDVHVENDCTNDVVISAQAPVWIGNYNGDVINDVDSKHQSAKTTVQDESCLSELEDHSDDTNKHCDYNENQEAKKHREINFSVKSVHGKAEDHGCSVASCKDHNVRIIMRGCQHHKVGHAQSED